MHKNAYFSWSYVAEKFGGAVETLATSFAPNAKRMEYAIGQLSSLQEEHFPDDDIYLRYKKIMEVATRFGPKMLNDEVYEGSIKHTLSRSKKVTFERLAEEIWEINYEVKTRRGNLED